MRWQHPVSLRWLPLSCLGAGRGAAIASEAQLDERHLQEGRASDEVPGTGAKPKAGRRKAKRKADGSQREGSKGSGNAAWKGAKAIATLKSAAELRADQTLKDQADASAWFSKNMTRALECYRELMDQDDDLRVKFMTAKDILARTGNVSPLDKIPSSIVEINGAAGFADPREQEAMMGVLKSMATANEQLVGSLLPINRIADSRYVTMSETDITEPDRPQTIDVTPQRED